LIDDAKLADLMAKLVALVAPTPRRFIEPQLSLRVERQPDPD
jgi:hypothetical protein